MTARTRHFARPGDLTGPEHAVDVLCGTQSKSGPTVWATETEAEVTCKKCLKVLAEIDDEARAVAAAINTPFILDEADEEEVAEVLEVIAKNIADFEPTTAYTSDLFATPTGPLVERFETVVPNDFDDKAIAARHGLQRFEVENAINDGWLKR